MAMLWSDREDGAQSELSRIEVDEVSVVDRPATGRRFVLFKRGGPLRRASGENGNKCSHIPAADGAVEQLRKRAEDAEAALTDLRAHTARLEQRLSFLEEAGLSDRLSAIESAGLEKRLASVEKARPSRQSNEEAGPCAGIWSGIL